MKVIKTELGPQSYLAQSERPETEPEPDSRLAKIINLMETDQFAQAKEILSQVLRESDPGWQTYYLLGLIQAEDKELADAGLSFQRALDLAPREKTVRSSIYIALAQNLEDQGDLPHARQYYLTALNLDPQSIIAAKALQRLKPLSELQP